MTDEPVKDQSVDDALQLLNSAGLMHFLEGALQEVRAPSESPHGKKATAFSA